MRRQVNLLQFVLIVSSDFFINSCRLMGIPLLGAQYTWCNGRLGFDKVENVLNRSLASIGFFSFWKFLRRHYSDHTPLILNCLDSSIQVLGDMGYLWLS